MSRVKKSGCRTDRSRLQREIHSLAGTINWSLRLIRLESLSIPQLRRSNPNGLDIHELANTKRREFTPVATPFDAAEGETGV